MQFLFLCTSVWNEEEEHVKNHRKITTEPGLSVLFTITKYLPEMVALTISLCYSHIKNVVFTVIFESDWNWFAAFHSVDYIFFLCIFELVIVCWMFDSVMYGLIWVTFICKAFSFFFLNHSNCCPQVRTSYFDKTTPPAL